MTDLMPQTEPIGFYGPYRGIVTNTTDPANQNRIKAVVPQLFGNTTTETDWALPCQAPGLQSLPTPGQGVWIMFEGGDLNYPVFMGMWQPEPSVAPYEVAGAGASAVAQAVATAEATSEAFTVAYSSMTLIAKQILAAPAATMTFSNIPQTFNHLHIKAVARSAAAQVGDNLCFQFNGDSGANYDEQWNSFSGTTSNSSSSQGQNRGIFGQIAAGNNTAGVPGIVIVDIPIYTATTFRKVTHGSSGYSDQISGADSIELLINVCWRNTAAITSMTFLTGTGSNFTAGTAVYLYGVL